MLDIAQTETVLQRSFGRGETCFDASGLKLLLQKGCAKIMLPKPYGKMPEAVIVNTAGGLTGGDVFETSCEAKDGAPLCVTSQTAERVYRSKSGRARVSNELKIGAGSRLDWLPQESILFEQSALERRLLVEMEQDSTLLALESVMLGRQAMGETLHNAKLNDQWRIKRAGKIIYADGLRFGPDIGGVLGRLCVFGKALALANLIYVAPDAEQRLVQARELAKCVDCAAVVSTWNGILMVRFLAEHAQELRKSLSDYLVGFRSQPMPRVWQM